MSEGPILHTPAGGDRSVRTIGGTQVPELRDLHCAGYGSATVVELLAGEYLWLNSLRAVRGRMSGNLGAANVCPSQKSLIRWQ